MLTFYLILYQSKNCGHRIHVLFMMYDVYWYCQMKKNEWLWKFWKRNDLYENFEKRGGSREKGGGGNEIHAPCACAWILWTGIGWNINITRSQVKVQILYICVIRCKMCSWFRYNYQFCPNLVWWIWVGRKHSTSSYLSTILMRWTRWSIDLTSYAKVHHKLMSKNLSFMCRRCDILHSREVV